MIGANSVTIEPVNIDETVKMCRHCFMCRHANSTFRVTKLDSHTPRGYALMLSRLRGGLMEWSEKTAQRFFESTVDGLCSSLCEFNWREDEVVRAGRREAWTASVVPDAVVAVERGLQTGEPTEVSAVLPDANFSGPAEVLLLSGVRTLRTRPGAAVALATLLTTAGYQWRCLPIEHDLGTALFDLGRPQDAAIWARRMADEILQTGVKLIVTPCADSYRALVHLWPELGVDITAEIRVQHSSTFLVEAYDSGRLAPNTGQWDQLVAIHDACGVARSGDIVDDPRAVVRSITGRDALEWNHCGSSAECCGGGGRLNDTYPKLSALMATARMNERPTEAQIVVTTGAACANVLAGKGDQPIRVMDLVEFAALSLTAGQDDRPVGGR